MNSRVLIVGGGQAAVEMACSLRSRGWQGGITMVTDEAHSPYQRPPLSKAFLAGKATTETLALRSDDFYAREAIEVIKSDRVEAITAPMPTEIKPGIAVTQSGREIEFEKLVLAVGASPRKIQVPGSDADGIFYLRDIQDAQQLKAQLGLAQSVVVVGGGFIGLEAAAVARTWGKKVTVIEAGPRLMGRVVAPVVSDFYAAAHRCRGVTVELNLGVVGFGVRNGRIASVEVADGRSIPADIVIVGIGVIPRTELAEQLGLKCDGGICVNEFANTSHPSIFAIGDCTVGPHPLSLTGSVRLESVQNAVDQAKVGAAALTRCAEPYSSVPWFWSDQDTLKLQIAGLSGGYDETVVTGSPEQEKFAVYYFLKDRLLAVDAINSPKDFIKVKKLLTSGNKITKADI